MKGKVEYMILSDKDIRELCVNDEGDKLIVPFSETSLQSESYDLSIGETVSILKRGMNCIELNNQDMIDKMYETISIVEDGYILSPHEYILVSVKETISLPQNLTAHIRPRTKFTRLGLVLSSQHCNSTYSGNLQLGLYNCTNFPIKLVSNIKFAQIVFEELKSIPSQEKQYKNRNATYQNERQFIGAKFDNEFQEKVDKIVHLLFEKEEE